MPIIIPKDLPAYKTLTDENIFIMDEQRANTQDIRPLELAIVNLMPTKEKTETQLLRRISNTALQVNVDFVQTKTHDSKNVSKEHLEKFYVSLDDIRDKKYDAMIITGAPVEEISYEEVDYWKEMTEILDFARKNVFSTLFICWASQAALYHYYGIEKHKLDKKLFGVYECELNKNTILTSGFDESFFIPHSRHTYCKLEDIKKIGDIDIISSSCDVGLNIASTKDERFIFVAGHGEYDFDTLENEYLRDKNAGLPIELPKNYYKNDDINKGVSVKWRAHSNLLFSNWLNYCVYQRTPYNISEIEEKAI
ncbi:homoserine O-succinyltransferase [Peptostreptococcus porci]|uniref:homoserine O-succinyltransferase n=1 Tax=Peptostreptococcus porci TaxID=2652282 RepID=UPI002A7FB908|nr:homoserine O-succinyltransferase [Peptostreptococcus porci]MDY4128538.1 homoserine O-succinyltransferase [Peptostreptococcus porci]